MNRNVISNQHDFVVIRSMDDLLEQTSKDLYILGEMSRKSFDEVIDIIKNDPGMQNVRDTATPEIEKRWADAISDFHNGKTDPFEYAQEISDLMDEMDQLYRDNITDSYDRAMGII